MQRMKSDQHIEDPSEANSTRTTIPIEACIPAEALCQYQEAEEEATKAQFRAEVLG